MAKKGKLLAALDAHKGRDYEKERQKRMAKDAEKRNKAKAQPERQRLHEGAGTLTGAALNGVDIEAAVQDMESELSTSEDESTNGVSLPLDEGDQADEQLQGELEETTEEQMGDEGDGDEDDEDGEDGEDDEDEEDGLEEDIPISDIESLASEDREDLLPHQRLTINNTSALLKAYKSIALPPSLPFSAAQRVTSSTQTEIPDVNDDLTREVAFQRQCLEAAVQGQARLKKEGVPFSRPNDFFAEMVKTDEHMGKIKAKLVEQAASKKAASEARKQRDLKKFGKQVQIAKQQERDRQKRNTLDKINLLKRKRKDMGDTGGATESDMFDVALDNETRDMASGASRKDKGAKRAKKDSKFGFGGKKRFAKSNDATSSGDMRGFSARRMKAGAKRGKTSRPGKSKRARTT